MKTIHIQEGVSEEACIFEELINERYEEYRYDLKRPLLSPDDLFIKYKDFLDNVTDKKINHFKLDKSLEIELKEKKIKERNEKSDLNLQNMPTKNELVVHLTHGIGLFNGAAFVLPGLRPRRGLSNVVTSISFPHSGHSNSVLPKS